MSLPLKDVIAAISADIKKAEINADVEHIYWRNIYDEHEMLKEFAPSKVRVREVKVSMPFAIDELTEAETIRPEVTAQQIQRILPEDMPSEDKNKVAESLELHLHKKERHLLSRTLFSELNKELKRQLPSDMQKKVDMAPLERLKRDYLATPKQESKLKVLFKNADLEQVPRDQLMRMDFTIEID